MVITSQGIPDATGAVQAGTKEMLISAISRMSVKSAAFRFVDYDQDQYDINALQNLVGEVSAGRVRWEKCLERLRVVAHPHIVIEASLDDILAGRWGFSKVRPVSVVGSLLAWAGRHRIPAWLAETAERGELITQWILARHANDVWSKR